MGAALTYKAVFADEVVFTVAAVTKLTRNVFLALVIPWLGLCSSPRPLAPFPSLALICFLLITRYIPSLCCANFSQLSGVCEPTQWCLCSQLNTNTNSVVFVFVQPTQWCLCNFSQLSGVCAKTPIRGPRRCTDSLAHTGTRWYKHARIEQERRRAGCRNGRLVEEGAAHLCDCVLGNGRCVLFTCCSCFCVYV
jgi:hypothetical protein